MAKMIPSVMSPNVKSDAERSVFSWFANAPGTEEWVVLHSLGLANHQAGRGEKKKLYAEIDFLVLAPRMGAFVLEVKGGRVWRDEGGLWNFKNRYDNIDRDPEGPFTQVKNNGFSFMKDLKKRLDRNHNHLNNMLFYFGVMFPDFTYEASSSEEEQWQIFDDRNDGNVARYIQTLFQGAKRKREAIYGPLPREALPTVQDVNYISELLRGEFDKTVSLRARLKHAQDQHIALTKKQYKCLDRLEYNPRMLIRGGAGTGKTLLALEETKRATIRGQRVGLFCFNRNLGAWLKAEIETDKEFPHPVFCGRFHKYAYDLAKNAGLLEKRENVGSEEFAREVLPKLALDALRETGPQFDWIIVDEVQDLMLPQYLDVLDACLVGGMEQGRWTFFGDFSMQAIYTGETEGQMMSRLGDRGPFSDYLLDENCRNTKQIGEVICTATEYVPPMEDWIRVNGSPVDQIPNASKQKMAEKLDDLLSKLRISGVAPEKITILSPSAWDKSIASMVVNHRVFSEYDPKNRRGISFCTVQGYKGLENDVIILTDISSFSNKQLMYVALSRACAMLYILETEQAFDEYNRLLIRRVRNNG